MSIKRFKGVSLKRIQQFVDKVLENTRLHYNTEPRGEEFESFVQAIYETFPVGRIRYDVVFASVMDLAGKLVTPEIIKNTAWRLIANVDKLRNGKVVPTFTQQTEVEWCLVSIVKATVGYNYRNEFGYHYDYRVLSGQAAGKLFTVFWSMKQIRFVARTMGFKRTRKVYFKLTDGAELVRMRVYFLFNPEKSKDGKPYIEHFAATSSCIEHNQTILKQRFRIIPCPEDYSLTEMPCYRCPMGVDRCAAACHRLTYKVKGCPRCMKESWFDPEGRGVICTDCEEQERRTRGRKSTTEGST